jgi:hypothetical protein
MDLDNEINDLLNKFSAISLKSTEDSLFKDFKTFVKNSNNIPFGAIDALNVMIFGVFCKFAGERVPTISQKELDIYRPLCDDLSYKLCYSHQN